MPIISNTKELSLNLLREKALAIAEAGLSALDSSIVIRNSLKLENNNIYVGDKIFPILASSKLIVIGVGKCAINAVSEVEKILGDHITSGIVLDVHENTTCKFKKIKCITGSHPTPTEKNVVATKEIVAMLSDLTPSDLVLFIISGGGSALLCLPEEGSVYLDESLIVSELFRVGASIKELNTLRKHISLARGGYLAKYAYPAHVVSLIFSDVPGNDINFISSGPTVKDMTTIVDAEAVLSKYQILKKCNILHCGLIETPKDEKYFSNVYNYLVLSNEHALKAMSLKAKSLGLRPSIQDTKMVGEAKVVGERIAKEISQADEGRVLLYGGETTVVIHGHGRGGRNQELALGALKNIQTDTLVLSLASDGKDNGPYAGAIMDREILENSNSKGLDSQIFFAENNVSEFFEQSGGLLKTGDTGSNVSDLIIAIKDIQT